MTAKEYLLELENLRIKVQQKQEEKQMFLEMATSITVPFNPMKVQTSQKVDRMENAITKATDIDGVIEKEIGTLLYRQCEIVEEIQALHNVKYMQVLFKVYVQGKSIRRASIEMKLSYHYVIELHKKALEEFDRVYVDKLS